MQDTIKRARNSLLDTPLTSAFNINIEVLLWGGIILFTIVTRFWDLGSRSYNHDESLHTVYSWYLYQGRGYRHDPMMHGPFQFHFIALLYFLFGDSDYTGRMLAAIFGVVLVGLCIYLRPYLGRTAALLTALFVAIAPDFMYYSRFARGDIYVANWELLAVIALFGLFATRKARFFILGAVAISLLWATKETVFIFGFMAVTFLVVAFIFDWRRKGKLGLFDTVRALDWPTVAIGLSAALAIFVVLYTTFFTNLDGLRSGAIGAIEYWLAQQEVARGGQPWYYYLILLPLYNFLPLIPALIGVGYYALRRNTASASFGVSALLLCVMAYAMWGRPDTAVESSINALGPIVTLVLAFAAFALGIFQFMQAKRATAAVLAVGGLGFVLATFIWVGGVAMPPVANSILFISLLAWTVISLTVAALQGRGDRPLFTAFMIHWLLVSFIVYSWAGEKMPWLSLHLSLPAMVLAATFINDLWLRVDWHSVRARGAIALGLLMPIVAYTLLRVLLVAPFQGISLQKIDATIQWLTAVVIGGLLLFVAYRVGRRLNRGEIAQVAFAALLVVMTVFTLRAAFMAAFEHGDIAVEMLIYAQGAPDVPVVMRDINLLSEKLTGGKDMDIVVESSETWPFAWYLRDYKKVAYPASLDGPPTAPVVIAGFENAEKYKPWMTNYIGVKEKLIWWFAEDYKGLTPEKIVTDLADPKMRESLFNFLFYRKFEIPLGQWPLRKEFTFYVRKDVANLVWTPAQLPPAEVDKSDKEFQDKIVSATAKTSIGLKGAGDGQFNTPKGVAVGGDGAIYVADAGNNRIQKFDGTGRYLLSLTNQGGPDGQFQEPWAVAAAPDGSVYVADTWNHRIIKFDAGGNFVTAWGVFGDTANQAAPDKPTLLYGPRSVTVDPQGNVWVVDTGNKRVVKYSSTGQFMNAYGGLGTAAGQFAEPVGIAISAGTGDIYVADTWNHRVQRFSKDFTPLAQFPVNGWDSTSVVNKPYIALDAADNVYVTDPENHRILKYAPDGKLLAVVGKPGADLSSFNLPTGIAIDAQGNILVSDSFNNRLLRFDPLQR